MTQNKPTVCWKCNKLMGVADTCPYCGAPRAQALTQVSKFFKNIVRGGYPTTSLLFMFCIFIFFVGLIVTLVMFGPAEMFSSIMNPNNAVLALLGLNTPKLFEGLWWGPLLSVFLHIGIIHIAFNMYALRILGQLFEPIVGSKIMWLIFLVSGVAGGVLTAYNGNAAAGASGGIFGIMGAGMTIVFFRGGGFDDPVFRSLAMWAGITFMLGFFLPMDNWGHGGGLVTGAILGYIWQVSGRNSILNKVATPFLYISILAVPVGYAHCVLFWLQAI